MPSVNWSRLTPLQLGKYAEYYAKMEFSSYGFDVYTSEVDDHGVDFIAKSASGVFYEVQVKSVRGFKYAYIQKSKMKNLTANRLVCYLRFDDGFLPEVYLIPAKAWECPNAVLQSKDYSEEHKSKPEWGINISRKNHALLDNYRIEKSIHNYK